MEQVLTIHFIDPSSRIRAELARIAFNLGYHAEVYSDFAEITERPPGKGLILARDNQADGGIEALMRRLENNEIWLPVIALAENPTVARTVSAMKAGAIDYFRLPLDIPKFEDALDRIRREASEFGESRKRMFNARNRIASLSNREREVLGLLTDGQSNKEIARALDISPRTVEIHRANMMSKLGARHPAEAVRLSIEAQIETPRAA